jgi:hypothetical protein
MHMGPARSLSLFHTTVKQVPALYLTLDVPVTHY